MVDSLKFREPVVQVALINIPWEIELKSSSVNTREIDLTNKQFHLFATHTT